MGQDTVKWGGDATELLTELMKIKKAFGLYNTDIDKMIVKSLRFAKTGELMGATLKGVTSEGKEVTQTLTKVKSAEKELADQFVTTSAAVKESSKSIKERATSAKLNAKRMKDILKNHINEQKQLEQKANKERLVDAKLNAKRMKAVLKEYVASEVRAEKEAGKQRLIAAKLNAKRMIQVKRATVAALQVQQSRNAGSEADQFIGSSRSGVNLTGKSIGAKSQLASAETALKLFLIKNQQAGARIQAIWRDVSKGEIKTYGQGLDQLRNKLIALQKAHQRANNEQSKAHRNLESGSKAASRSVDAQKKRVQSLILSWKSVLRLAAVSVIHRAVSSLIMQVREATTVAVDLRIALAEIETISNGISSADINSGLRSLSDEFGIDILEQAESAYETLSNQVAETNSELVAFLQTTNDFALATKTTANDSVNLLTSAINAYSLDVSEAERISASFFKTIELGRVRGTELANSMGKTLVPASQLGISLDEVNAAISLTTIKGVKADEALTLIRNVMLKLIRPTDEMKEFFKELGVESGEAAIQTFGFSKFMALLEERTQGSSSEIGELFGRIRAITGALIFAGGGLDEYNKILAETKQGTEQYNKAIDLVKDNLGKKFRIELNKTKNFFIQDVGQDILETLGHITNDFKLLLPAMKLVVHVIQTAVIPAVAALTVHVGRLSLAFAIANPIVAAFLAGFGLVTVAVTSVELALKKANEEIERLGENSKKEIIESTKEERNSFNERILNIREFFSAKTKLLLQQHATERGLLQDQFKEQLAQFEDMEVEIEDVLGRISDGIQAAIKDSTELVNKLTQSIESSKSKISGIDNSIFSLGLESDLSGLEDLGQFDQLVNQIRMVQDLRRQSAAGGDHEGFENQTSLLNTLLSKRENLANQLIRDGQLEEHAVDIIREKIALLEDEKRLRLDMIAVEEAALVEAQQARLRRRVEEEQLLASIREIETFKLSSIIQSNDTEALQADRDRQLRLISNVMAHADGLGLDTNKLAERRDLIDQTAESRTKDLAAVAFAQDISNNAEEATRLLDELLKVYLENSSQLDDLKLTLIDLNTASNRVVRTHDDEKSVYDLVLGLNARKVGDIYAEMGLNIHQIQRQLRSSAGQDILDIMENPDELQSIAQNPERFKALENALRFLEQSIDLESGGKAAEMQEFYIGNKTVDFLTQLDALANEFKVLNDAKVFENIQTNGPLIKNLEATLSSLESTIEESNLQDISLENQVQEILNSLNGFIDKMNAPTPSDNAGSLAPRDINISIASSGSTAVDVMAIGKALEREIQRGTITL